MLRNLRFCQCLSLARVAHQLLAWLPMDYLSRSYASELLGSPFELLAHDTVAHIWAQPKAWHEPRFFRMHPRAAQTWGQSEIPTQQARPGSRGIQTSSAAQSLTTAGPNDVLEEPSASVHSIALLRNGCLLAAFLAKSAAWRSCVLKHWLQLQLREKMPNGRTLENMQLEWSQVSSMKPRVNRINVRSRECRRARMELKFMCL